VAKKIIKEIGKAKRDALKARNPRSCFQLFEANLNQNKDAVFCGVAPGKDAISMHLQDEWKEAHKRDEELKEVRGSLKRFFEDKVDEEIHRGAVEDNKRADNRAL
jgi:hypothetical protein